MGRVDRAAPLVFLSTAFEPEDWLAVLLKSYDTGWTTQRVGPRSLIASAWFQAWLRARNARGENVYLSVNTLAAGQRSRRREVVRAVRHVFLDADDDARAVLHVLATRLHVPPPSFVVQTSPGRAHFLWRVRDFATPDVEVLQKHLAVHSGADRAATSASQMTRLPGFMNYKCSPPHLVTVQGDRANHVYTSAAFPAPPPTPRPASPRVSLRQEGRASDRVTRARRYIEAVPPAIAGQRGDAQTFRLCCRLVRGFALSDDEAFALLARWNQGCQPPWTARELFDKLRYARRYGREPIGALLTDGSSSGERMFHGDR